LSAQKMNHLSPIRLGANTMQLIDDLINQLSDEASSTQGALLKAQILGHRLGDSDLAAWVEHELRGYPDEAVVPSYRRLRLTLTGHVTNGVYHYSNQTLPTQHLKEPLKTNLTHKDVRDSISAIESWSGKDDIRIAIPAEAYHVLSEPLSQTYFVQQAWGKPSVGAIDQILVQVRSRLLEFCLKISDQLPPDLTPPELRKKAQDLSSNEIFRHAVFGDNVTIVVGSGSIRNVENKIVRDDFQSLREHLKEHGISEPDIAELKTALTEDSSSKEVQNQTIGPRVKDWLGSMMGKAGTVAWQVSIGAAGSILGAAIDAYYRFRT
jgi:hypothetical protein